MFSKSAVMGNTTILPRISIKERVVVVGVERRVFPKNGKKEGWIILVAFPDNYVAKPVMLCKKMSKTMRSLATDAIHFNRNCHLIQTHAIYLDFLIALVGGMDGKTFIH